MTGSGKRKQDMGLMLAKQLRGLRGNFFVAILNCKGRGLMPWGECYREEERRSIQEGVMFL